MALSREEAKELAEQLKQIEKLSNSLKKNINTTSLKDLEKNAATIRHLFASLSKEWDEITADISSAAVGFKNIVQEITLQNQGIKESVKGYKGLASIAEKIQYYQRGISDLSSKEIEKLKTKAKAEKLRLENAKNLLDLRRTELGVDIQRLINQKRIIGLNKDEAYELRRLQKEHKQVLASQANINGLLTEQDELYNNLLLTLNRVSDEVGDVEKLLGLGGVAVKGLSVALTNLGFGDLASKLGLDEANEKMKKVAQDIQQAGGNADSLANKFKVLKVGIRSIGGSLLENLKDPLVISAFLINQILNAFKLADSQTGLLAKSFNLTYSEANNVRDELNTIANLSGNINVNTKSLQESMVAVGQSLGSNAKLNEKDLKTFTKLREMAGYTNDELVGIQQLSLVNGKTLEDNTKEILGGAAAYAAQNKLVINEKEVLKEINKASAALKLSLGASADALAIAVVQAKQFGLNLAQAESISNSLLQFEDSISSELEAELLVGREFNFERARALALEGKAAEAAAEVAKQVGSAKDFGKLNVIQQETIAKAIGMQREDLAKSLIEKEALAKLSAKEGESAQQAFNRLVEEVGMEEAKRRLGDEQLANQFQQQSVQEKFNATVEKLKEVFISLVTPLMPVLDTFSEIFKIVGPIVGAMGQMLKFLVPIAKYVGLIVVGYKTLRFLGDIIYRRTILTSVAKRLGLITDQQAVVQAKITSMLGKDFIRNETKAKLIKQKGLVTTIKENIQKRLGLSLDKRALAGQIKSSLIKAKDFLVEKAANALRYARNALMAVSNALGITGNTIAATGNRQSLLGMLRAAGKFVLNMFNAGAQAPPPANLVLPFVLGGIAGAIAAGIVTKFSKGDDIISPGYGKRTLLSPEGAISLNDKDTVIAGTNLGGKGQQQQPQTQAPSSPSVNMQPVVDRLIAVENVLNQILNKSSDVYMDSTKVGTALNIGSVQIQ